VNIENTSESLRSASVILPIRNEVKHIRTCLERLLTQDYPADKLEILVIDGMSEDGTRDIVREMIREHPERRLRLLDNPKRIVPPALNIGIQAAEGEIVIRMDGHTVPAPDYVSACVRALEATGAANVGGVIGHTSDTPFGKAVAKAQGHPLGVGGAKFRYAKEGQYVDTVPFGAFRREIFEKTGLFDESMIRNQDYEMNVRIRKTGGKIYLDPAIHAVYTPRDTPRRLWKQYFEYGWWRVETIRRHPDSLRWRQAIPPVFVAAVVLLGLLSFWPVARALLALAVVPYVAVLGATSWRLRRELARPWQFGLAVAIMHFAFGLGFWTNLLSGGRWPYRAQPPQVPRYALRQGAVREGENVAAPSG
jgi:cellulose synthase/poly-beta-1,6-N-acetylglucosamine synthase-like glycosyltransferase